MPTTAPEPTQAAQATPTAPAQTAQGRLQVAVGVLRRQNRLLMQQRTPGQPCAGQWEFPGGKVEQGESPRHALQREIREELGVETVRARPLLALPFDYPHARVWLEVFVVDSFTGQAVGREGQQTRWLTPEEIRCLDVLAAVYPILEALEGEQVLDFGGG